MQSWCSLADSANSESLVPTYAFFPFLSISFRSNFQVLGACRGVQQCYQPCALVERDAWRGARGGSLGNPRCWTNDHWKGWLQRAQQSDMSPQLRGITCWSSMNFNCWSVRSVQSCGFFAAVTCRDFPSGNERCHNCSGFVERSDGLGEECMLVDERSCSARKTCGILRQHWWLCCREVDNMSRILLIQWLCSSLIFGLPFLRFTQQHSSSMAALVSAQGDLPRVRCTDSCAVLHFICFIYLYIDSKVQHLSCWTRCSWDWCKVHVLSGLHKHQVSQGDVIVPEPEKVTFKKQCRVAW